MGGQLSYIPRVVDTVDPLHKIVSIGLHEKIPKGINRTIISYLFKEFGEANKCQVSKVVFLDESIEIHILMVRRLGPEMNENPML